MKNKISSYILLLAIVLALIPAALPAYDVSADAPIEVEIQPDGALGKDSQIVSSAASTNYGTSVQLGVGENNTLENSIHRSLLDFDLTGLPYDMVVTSAFLNLTVDQDLSSNARTIYAYPIKNTWTETVVSWIQRNSGGVNWQTPGASGENDAGSEPVGQLAVSADLTPGTVISIPLDPSFIEALRRGNYLGLKLQMDVELDDLYFFRSSDHATAEDRPKLVVTYNPDGIITDPGWVCVDGMWLARPLLNCSTYAVQSPYNQQHIHNQTSAGGAVYVEGAKLQCDPYPRCVNDFDIHYRIHYRFEWFANVSSSVALGVHFEIPGMPDVQISESEDCGSGVSNFCEGIFEGIILASQLPENTSNEITLGVWTETIQGGAYMNEKHFSTTVYYSIHPYNQECADTWYVPLVDTFDIDPVIETPLGPYGEPPDDQIYATAIGKSYMVRVVDGPWNDGSQDRTDAAVSFDGETWMTWADFQLMAFCVDTEPDMADNLDYKILYFAATTETFYIRANDEPEEFGDNDTPGETFKYKIGAAYGLVDTPCTSQFTYDPVADWFVSAQIYSDEEIAGLPVQNTNQFVNNGTPMQVGEWYAIEVANGTWNEPGGEPRIDMEYSFRSSAGLDYPEYFADLADGAPHVQCVQDSVVYVQAPAELLALRVNDQSQPYNFADNTGVLGINIYHAGYQRPPEVCELNFALDLLVSSDSVEAQQQYGKYFAFTVGSALTNNNTTNDLFAAGGLVPGAWYALETIGGPWGYYGEGVGVEPNDYDLAIALPTVYGSVDETEWFPLEEWDVECNVETDTLGHRMVYFQAPVAGLLYYKLRVNDIGGVDLASSASWNSNTGSMSWNLYRAIDLGPTDTGICDYSFDPENKLNQTVQTVVASAVDGAYISSGAAIGQPVGTPTLLLPNTYYAVELLGEDFKWYEYNGGDPQTDMQLSRNNGTSWANLPGAGELCSIQDGENLIFFIRTGDETAPRFKLRVASESFENNVGFMGYNIYAAEAGPSINPFNDCVTQGYVIAPFSAPDEWIPVTAAEGRSISTTGTFSDLSALVPGNKYVLETTRGPWKDGENDLERFQAQVSSDGGVTWNDLDGTNPDITCWTTTPDIKYRRIEFTVQAGQVWRIRVKDVDSETFTDNTGNLAFKLKGLILPDDPAVTGTFTLAGCNSPPVLPGLLSVSELLNLGNYLAQWFDYVVGSVVSFFAWCPDNTSAVTMFMEDINTRDPFASLNELQMVLNDIRNEINGYNWGGNNVDYSFLTKTPTEAAQMINQYVLGPLPSNSPWRDGNLIDLTAQPPADMYSDTCQLSLNDFIGPKLGQGACFSFNWARNVGLMFYLQLMLDIGVVFAAIHSVITSLRKAIYLFTGVNLSMASSDAKVFVNVITDNENRRGRR